MDSQHPPRVLRVAEPAVLRVLAAEMLSRAAARAGRRWMVGIAGIPGAGKSTLAALLLDHLRALGAGAPIAVVVPMDGFHLTNLQLAECGLRDRKGSPPTFDAEAYIGLLGRAADPAFVGPFPVYDRAAHEPVWHDVRGQRIEPATRVIITEGNYLLLDHGPWARLAEVLDETWGLETPAAVARRWLVARHVRGGRAAEDAELHVCRSDDANTALVMNRSRLAEVRLRWPDEVVKNGEKSGD